ncbi:methyltransferase domain-containing protein [Propionivibrio sp.]|uniref:class I SAM-dependent methyltransferase n=1 Tax=Propionivibrio sp. TaxID=2212460 RepID=UPI0025FE3D83|nr:methyltransferase domain-containing protein [Propionivibrio sp.]MBK8744990.1 methyltransferase domain-containing protein [Propionivibrio sp.]
MENTSDQVPLKDQRTYYDNYWRTHKLGLIPDEVTRLAEILHAVALILPNFKNREIRICDLGCGRGWISAELSKFGTVTAVDLSPQAIQSASERWPQVDFQSADILTWRPDDSFDLVVTSEVIEHVPDHKLFADTVSHLLRNGGYLILTTPNGKVKRAWDAINGGSQIIENWLKPAELRQLFSLFKILRYKVFILDFSYVGIFRITSAPKLLRLINLAGIGKVYDLIREWLRLGLYQILVARFEK